MTHQINPFGVKTPYDQGYLAYVQIGANASNPFEYGSEAWEAWIAACESAMSHSQFDEDGE